MENDLKKDQKKIESCTGKAARIKNRKQRNRKATEALCSGESFWIEMIKITII